MNIEANHAELAGHDFHHELETAAALGLFGSVDANRALLATTPATAGTPTSSP